MACAACPVLPLRAAETVLETLPHDAIAAIQVNRPQRLLPREQLQTLCAVLTSGEVRGRKLADAVIKLPGELVIGILESNDKKQKFDFSVTLDLKGFSGDIDEMIRKDFLPAAAELDQKRKRTFELDTSAKVRRIVTHGAGDTVFAYAINKEILFGCTQPRHVQRWLSGEWPDKRLVANPGVRRALAKASRGYAVRAILNPAFVGLLNRREKPPGNSWEELINQIYPAEEIESIIAEIEWEKSVLSLRLDVAFSETCVGIIKILGQAPTTSQYLGAFSADYPIIGRIGWPSLQSIIDGAYALTDRFDPAISQEYREDLAKFKEETGCDWAEGILGNLTGDMAFGVRVDFTKMPPIAWAAVCPLADEAKFNAALEKLISHFGLPFEEKKHAEFLVRTAQQMYPFCICVDHGRLILGDGTQAVVEIAKSKGTDRLASAALRNVYQRLGEKNQAALLIDIEQLATTTPLAMMAPEKLKKLLVGQMGICLSNHDRIARLDFRWDMSRRRSREIESEKQDSDEESVIVLLGSAVDSIRQARAESQKTVSSSNMRGMGQGFYIYAQSNKGQFPPDLATLLQSNNVNLEMFTNPYTGDTVEATAVDRDCYLLYRPGLTISSDPREILLAEKPREGGDGANFLFVDSHVEFIAEPQASELIAKMVQGEDQVRPNRDADR